MKNETKRNEILILLNENGNKISFEAKCKRSTDVQSLFFFFWQAPSAATSFHSSLTLSHSITTKQVENESAKLLGEDLSTPKLPDATGGVLPGFRRRAREMLQQEGRY